MASSSRGASPTAATSWRAAASPMSGTGEALLADERLHRIYMGLEKAPLLPA